VPLAVDSGIELPQLELVSNFTGDCTSVYSTGQSQRASIGHIFSQNGCEVYRKTSKKFVPRVIKNTVSGLSKVYRVCHEFRLIKQDDNFESLLTTFKAAGALAKLGLSLKPNYNG